MNAALPAPLTGLKVADFSWVGAGPRATKDLADYGATVIKIESQQRLDLGRLSPPFKNSLPDPDGSAFFAIANTSKLSVTINLTDARGIAVAKRLVQWADLVVENFGTGYMERIGMSFETLKALKPDLIMLSVSATGRTGPLSEMRGYGNVAAALSGLAALSGWPDREPHLPPFAYGDVIAPMFATVGVLAALEHRRMTGRGQWIDVSQLESLVHVLADCFAARQESGESQRLANRSRTMAPHGAYPCRGPDQWCALAVSSDRQWRVLCELMAAPALAEDHRFIDLQARKHDEEALDALIGAWTSGQDKHLLADRLAQAGISAEAIQDGRDVFTDPELINSGHFVRIQHAVLGACDMPAPPTTFSASASRVGPAPLIGEHNHAVFVELLGMTPQELAILVDAGALK